jgi:hypothetical protein
VTDTSGAAWTEALGRLERSHNELQRAVVKLTDESLDELIGAERNRALGSGTSRYVTLHGTAQHSLYHAGQIMLLKKLV